MFTPASVSPARRRPLHYGDQELACHARLRTIRVGAPGELRNLGWLFVNDESLEEIVPPQTNVPVIPANPCKAT